MADTTGNDNPLDLSQYISGVTNQAYQNWGNQDAQMQWAKDQFAKNSGTAATVQGQDQTAAAKFAQTQDDMNRAATDDRALYTGTYVPAMKAQMDYAQQYTTPDRMAANRAAAGAQVATQMQDQRSASERALQSVGVDPSAGRYAGLDAGLAAKQAATQAGAMTTSDRTTEQLGQQYLANAIQTGQVLPGQAVNEAGLGVGAGNAAVNAGNAAVNTGLATTASGASTMGTPLQWNAAGNDMFKQWASAAGAQASAGQSQQQIDLAREKQKQSESSGAGALIGAGMGVLGSVAGAYFGGPAGASLGGKLGSALGGAAGGSSSGGSGTLFAEGGRVDDEEDMTDQYNTQLDPEEEQRYHDWAAQNHREGDTYDYDMRGAWKQGIEGDPRTGHYPDTYKKPNHPTFSDESQYDGSGGRRGGHWEEDETGSETLQPYGTHSHADGGRIEREFPTYQGLHNSPYDVEDRNMDEDLLDARIKMGEDFQHPEHKGREKSVEFGNIDLQPRDRPAPITKFAGGGHIAMISAFANGGDIPPSPPGPADDGGSNMVSPDQSPSGGAKTDDVHAMLNEGEFVMPKDVTGWLGEKFMQNLINKARTEMAGPKAEGQPGPPVQAMAMSPPSFRSEGARAGA